MIMGNEIQAHKQERYSIDMHEMSIESTKKIAAAVIAKAVLDAQKGSQEARDWLSSSDAELYFDILDLDQRIAVDFSSEDLPKKGKRAKLSITSINTIIQKQ